MMKFNDTFLVLAFSVAFTAGPALAAVERVTVYVDGLACPFCAYNIEKRVKPLDGVAPKAKIVTSLKEGSAKFPWKADVAFDPAAVRRAIREAGFTPREIFVKATGTIEVSAELDSPAPLRLEDPKAKLAVSVRPGERADRRESWEAMKDLASDTQSKLSVWVEGEVRSDSGDGSWDLVLHRWGPSEFGAEVIAEVDDLTCEQCSTRTMRGLMELEGVIHVEADHETDHVHIWTKGKSPDLSPLRQGIETLGFKVTRIETVASEGEYLRNE